MEFEKILSEVLHPEKGNRSIVELGMVQSAGLQDGKAVVVLGFPKRRDPLTEYLVGATRAALVRAGFKDNEVKAVVAQEDSPKPARQELGKEQLEGISRIIGIASGKGGVGKSTVSVNLACALARLGYKVGLADADVYGPSVPTMTGTEGLQPDAQKDENGRDLMIPIERYGVKWMSIGYFAPKGQALIWRGPMACNALKQMILQVKWGELDYLLIDMPPGTGDIHISLVQDIPMQSAIIVTTPQEVALSDVEKGAAMFRNENINREILGIVENMSWFVPEKHPDEKYHIFGQGGGARMAEELGVPLLAQIPLVQGIRQNADEGEPSALGSGPAAEPFLELARKISGNH